MYSFRITMMGAFAQSESENISQNVRWGQWQAMKEGEGKIPEDLWLRKG